MPKYDKDGVRLTDCCGTYSTFSDETLVCKKCFNEVPFGQGDGSEVLPDFLFKDEGEFDLVYPQNEKAMAFLKSMKSAHWYSEKSIAISDINVRKVKRVFESAGFTVEDC